MGNQLAKPISSVSIERNTHTICTSHHACINGLRPRNEDAHTSIAQTNIVFTGVFDGHMNDMCANYVAQHLPQKIFQEQNISPKKIKEICLELDREIIEDDIASGTTATFSVIKQCADGKYNVLICNIGDSMTIVLDKNFKLKFVTTDHKPFNDEERQRIIKCGGYINAGRVDGNLSVSRAFGDGNFKNIEKLHESKVIAVPDITSLSCETGDMIIHICDGITENNFSPSQVCQYIHENMIKYADASIVSALVCLEALVRDSSDNLSCSITILESNETPSSAKHFIPGRMGYKGEHFSFAYKKIAEQSGSSFEEALNKRLEFITKLIPYFEEPMSEIQYDSELEKALYQHEALKIKSKREAIEEQELILSIQQNRNTSTVSSDSAVSVSVESAPSESTE